MSNGLDPDQGGHSVGSNLGPNCLQRLSADVKVATSRDRVKIKTGDLLNLCILENHKRILDEMQQNVAYHQPLNC